MRLEPVHVAYAPYPVPLSFGMTVRGDHVTINNSHFSGPLVVIGNHETFVGDNFTGGEWGIFMADGCDHMKPFIEPASRTKGSGPRRASGYLAGP